MFKVETPFLVIPVIVADPQIFWNMAAHLGAGTKQWATYAEFEMTADNLEAALTYFNQQALTRFEWIAPLLAFFPTTADRFQFLVYEEGVAADPEEVVF